MTDHKECDGASVGVLVTDERGRVLVGTRADGAGLAPIAGHVWDEHDSYEDAAAAEVWEETGMRVTKLEYVTGGWRANRCKRGDSPHGPGHHWQVFRATATGTPHSADGSMLDLHWADHVELNRAKWRTLQRAQARISDAEWTADPGLEPVWVQWLHVAGIAVLSLADLHTVQTRLIEPGTENGGER